MIISVPHLIRKHFPQQLGEHLEHSSILIASRQSIGLQRSALIAICGLMVAEVAHQLPVAELGVRMISLKTSKSHIYYAFRFLFWRLGDKT